MAKNDKTFPLRDGLESLPEPLDLQRILPADLFERPKKIKLTIPAPLGTVLFTGSGKEQLK
ncbi:hypothetical protein FJU08_21170 [Martelella alba]|uniref:Uncharacterized protein n=1 Tax=Martelella alba TaxID=2590451 RepID=A0A506TZL7_9HYPH|nr:hypothetical protein [Martelella alba]TPW26950.1 hypothetical protein FJU08_21170 [Martelella alba]